MTAEDIAVTIWDHMEIERGYRMSLEEAERIMDSYRQDDDGSMDDIDTADVVDIINEWMEQYDETGAV